jgi:hypothetical protein
MLETLIGTALQALSIFKSDTAIGFIVVVMLACAALAILRVTFIDLHKNFCLAKVSQQLISNATGRGGDVRDPLEGASRTALAYDYPEFRVRWVEFSESVKREPVSGRLATPIDTKSIFNIEAIGLTLRNYERVAALFVSVGLVLTFMGLVAALQQSGVAILSAGEGDADIKAALSDLLLIVSSKFILSITGLICSILVNLAIDRRLKYNRRCVAGLNASISSAVAFVPAEVLLRDIRDGLARGQLERGAAP